MANTVVADGNLINITFDGLTDWDLANGSGLSTDIPKGTSVKSIQMVPSATGDTLIIRDGSATGPILAKFVAADVYDSRIKYFYSDRKYNLFVAAGEGSANVMMIVEL